jgi:ubiquinone/menaquinone biosynthesis C-methylase UbiE
VARSHVPAVAGEFDRWALNYDDEYSEPFDLAENAHLRGLLRKTIGPRPGRVIDLGCGTGLVLDLTWVDTISYLGVDVSLGMIDRARTKYPFHSFKPSDMASVAADSGTARAVICLFSLNYADDPMAVSREAYRLLAPGGRILFVTFAPGRHLHRKRSVQAPEECEEILPNELRQIFKPFQPKIRGMGLGVDRMAQALGVAAARGFLWREGWSYGLGLPVASRYYVVEGRM